MNNKIFKNIVWLMFDSALLLVLQLLVGVKTANYFGPEVYGIYSYAMAIVGFSPIFLEILNRRVIKEHYNENFFNTVNSVTSFRNLISLGLLLLGVFSYPLFKNQILVYYMIVLLLIDSLLNTQTMGIENYFEFNLESKKIVISNNIVKIISYSLQYLGMVIGLNILMMPIIRIFGSIIRMIILKYQYYKSYNHKIKKSYDFTIIKTIIIDSYYLWISFIALVIYTQIDKIMIGNLLGTEDVAIYSVSLQLIGILSILIGPFQSSIYPKMMEMFRNSYPTYLNFYKKMNLIFTQTYMVLTLLSIVVVYILFPYIYDSAYLAAIPCYAILTFSVFMKANGALQTGHMTLKKTTKKSFYKTLAGLFINVTLNILLIPKYGINGAALATSITQFFTIFIIDLFIKEYREQFFIQLYSLNPINLFFIKKGQVK